MEENRLNRMEAVMDRRQPDLTIVMENVFDPHNISAVLRTCDSVGIPGIHVINTRLPPHQHWGFRSSAGAWKWVKSIAYTDIDACLTHFRGGQKKIYAAHHGAGATSLYDMDLTGPIAIVFGNEQDGCSPEILEKCDGKIFIPQVGMVQSLNISVACAVILYEAFRQKQAAGHYAQPALPSQERAAILEEWTDFSAIRQQRSRKA